MKQSRKVKKSPANVAPPSETSIKKKPLSPLQQDLLAMAFLLIAVISLHSQLFLNKKIYDGGDSHEAIVKTAMINKYYEQTGDIPRWNPYPEGGIPNVFFLPKPVYSPDFYISKLGDAIGLPIVYLLIGVFGMYLLLRHLRFNIYLCVVVSLCFVLAPYYRSLIIVGQYLPTKFEAVMIIPWMMWFFLAFIERLKLLYLLLFSFFFALQLFTQHYQVIFYTGLLLLAVGIYPIFKLLRQKNYKGFVRVAGSLLGAFVFALLLTAYPLFVSKKYNDASIRATWGIDISKPAADIQKGSGVSVDFINQWSPAVRELSDLFIPAASGGTTKEKYSGSSAPELSGTELPAYWGKMTFSFSYLYFGLIVLLALAGLFYYRRNALVISLGIIGTLLTLWSLGTTLPGFYMFFYKFLPFFKNFRTPPTSMTVVFFIAALLSAYGLQFLLNESARINKQLRKQILFTLGGFLLIGLLFFLAGDSHDFTKEGENYEANYASLLLKARKELYTDDVSRYFLLVALLAAIIGGYLFRLYKYQIAIVLTGILLITDLALINGRYTNELMSGEEMYSRYMPSKPLADFFRNDKDVYRVFPTMDRGRDLSAVVPIIGDHDLQVLTTVYEINTNNLYSNIDGIVNINWNVLKIFGVKYFVCDRELIHPQLTLKYSNPATMEYIYQFNPFTSFGHFAKGDTVVPVAYERLKAINTAAFDPAVTVMLEKKLPFSITDDSSNTIVTKFTPNEITYDLYTGKQGLFVIPIPYVKDGWSIFIDDKEVNEVILANHAMQAIVVPPGRHNVTAKFNSSSYTSSYWISAIAWILFYLGIGFLCWKISRKEYKV